MFAPDPERRGNSQDWNSFQTFGRKLLWPQMENSWNFCRLWASISISIHSVFRDCLGCVHRSFQNLTITSKKSLVRLWDSKYESLPFNKPTDSISWKTNHHFYHFCHVSSLWFCYQAYVIRVTNSSSRHIACAWVLGVDSGWSSLWVAIRMGKNSWGYVIKRIGKPLPNWIHKFGLLKHLI